MCNRDRRRNILETKREWADRLAGGLPTATNLIATANPSAFLSIFRSGGFRYLTEGDVISFGIEKTDRGLKALNVEVIEN